MVGKIFVDEGYSCYSAVDQGIASYGLVTEEKITQNNKMLSLHSYI